jgi:hypothetical protein
MNLTHFKNKEDNFSHPKALQGMINEKICSRLKSMIQFFNESMLKD